MDQHNLAIKLRGDKYQVLKGGSNTCTLQLVIILWVKCLDVMVMFIGWEVAGYVYGNSLYGGGDIC